MGWFSFQFADFSYSFLSVLFEGVPFLFLGALIAGVVDVFVPARWLSRLLPASPTAAIFLSGLLGGIFPMCECGSVVVIRRFLAKGLPVSCAVAYMLAAPLVSPLVALSTFAAFQSENPWVMTSVRLLLGYGVAVGTALIVRQLPLASLLQRKLMESLPEQGDGSAQPGDAIGSGGPSRRERSGLTVAPLPVTPVAAPWKTESVRARCLRVVRSATSDFLDVALFFVMGTAVTAVFNTAIDQSILLPLATNGPVATVVMMALAGLLALCSSTDAFIAASFVAFPLTAKLAFLVFGPLYDVKLFFLYGMIFRRRFVILLGVGLFVTIALLCMRLSFLDV